MELIIEFLLSLGWEAIKAMIIGWFLSKLKELIGDRLQTAHA